MSKILFISFFLGLSSVVLAQDTVNSKAKPVFQSVNNVGMIEGEAGSAFQIQTINGIKFNSVFVGLGVGLDYYVLRSIPLFVDVRKDILTTEKTPFIYGEAGLNLPWAGNSYDWISDTDPGWFYDVGVGFRIPAKSSAFLISAGYSFKSYSHEEKFSTWCIFQPCPENVNQFDFKLRRLSVKAGFSF